MDEDADRSPESQGEINSRRERKAEMNREFSERRRELEEKAAADPWDYWPETHDDMYNPADYEIPPLWEILDYEADKVRRFSDALDPIAETIGGASLRPYYWSSGDNADLSQKLSGLEATRVYLYLDLSPLPEYRIADRLDVSRVRESLGIESSVSQSTLNRTPGRMGSRERTFYASETDTVS